MTPTAPKRKFVEAMQALLPWLKHLEGPTDIASRHARQAAEAFADLLYACDGYSLKSYKWMSKKKCRAAVLKEIGL